MQKKIITNHHYIFSVPLYNDPMEARVSQRIADATGLSMETAEPLLVCHTKSKSL